MKAKLPLGAALVALGAVALFADDLPQKATSGDEAQTLLRARQEALEIQLIPEARLFVEEYRNSPSLHPSPSSATKAIGSGWRLSRSSAPLHTFVAKRNPDGSLSLGCVQHPGELVEFLAAPTFAPQESDPPQVLRVEEK